MRPHAFPFHGDSYTTPSGCATFFGRLFPTLAFYAKFFPFVRQEGTFALHNQYTSSRWIYGSALAIHLLEESGVIFHVDGLDNVTSLQGPCIFLANHMSALETFALPSILRPLLPISFVVKSSLSRGRWSGPILNVCDPITLERQNPRADLTTLLDGGTKRLQDGISIIIFPQSTRCVEFNPATFNSIGIKLAKRAQVPIIPIALRTDAWGLGSISKDIGKIYPQRPVHFSFGKPISIRDGNGKKEHQQVIDYIAGKLQEWNSPVLPAGNQPPKALEE